MAVSTRAFRCRSEGLLRLIDPAQMLGQSANRCDLKLLADLARQSIVDLAMARHWRFRAVGRIDVNAVAAAFTLQPGPLFVQMPDEFVPLQALGAEPPRGPTAVPVRSGQHRQQRPDLGPARACLPPVDTAPDPPWRWRSSTGHRANRSPA